MSTGDRDVAAGGADGGLADVLGGWPEADRAATDAPSTGSPCAACGEPHARHRLTLTVEWRDYLVDAYGVARPEEPCTAPLCAKCRSWAEMLELAELNRGGYGERDRERIRAERDRFLDELRVELVANLRVSAELSGFE